MNGGDGCRAGQEEVIWCWWFSKMMVEVEMVEDVDVDAVAGFEERE